MKNSKILQKTFIIPHLMRNPGLRIWIPAFAGMVNEGSFVVEQLWLMF